MDIVTADGRVTLLWMLGTFVATFGITRGIVLLIRSGRGPFRNVAVGSVHVHHLVPGIFLMLIASALEFTLVPDGTWRIVLACVFAVGAALTLDEFALWLHLDDVYWAEEGRKSVDAVVYAAGTGLLLLAASNPFAAQQGESRIFWAASICLNLCLALVAVLKGRYFLGVAGVVIPFLALFGVLRLGHAGSPWFRWFYKPGSAKRARAERRARERRRRRSERMKNAIAGTPAAERRTPRRTPPGSAPGPGPGASSGTGASGGPH
ncbi:hypothetical protein [Yinghuangia soli]|uniref:Integral membrane protein n=1 Tax=Yinghuangia soli TaxID=2908204 RepID=A0AA41U2P9_9ACTN|nr:hypothetical protein [Yinghuangia soli]MCF2530925.1 hypothetical protein [Yinghuangia soli]